MSTAQAASQAKAQQPIHIDIVSDVMCPWCVIGYRQLATALEATGTPYEASPV